MLHTTTSKKDTQVSGMISYKHKNKKSGHRSPLLRILALIVISQKFQEKYVGQKKYTLVISKLCAPTYWQFYWYSLLTLGLGEPGLASTSQYKCTAAVNKLCLTATYTEFITLQSLNLKGETTLCDLGEQLHTINNKLQIIQANSLCPRANICSQTMSTLIIYK